MKPRTVVFALLAVFALPMVTASAGTYIEDFYDPPPFDRRQFTVFNDGIPSYDPNTGLVSSEEVIAFAVGLDDYFKYGTVATGRTNWVAVSLSKEQWDAGYYFDLVHGETTGPLSTTSRFGSFDEVFNGGGIQFSQGALYFDNGGPDTNNHIPAGGLDGEFYAYAPGGGDPMILGDFSVQTFTPVSTPAATLSTITTYTGDDGDGEEEEGETWVVKDTLDSFVLQDQTTIIPLPPAALMGLGLLSLLALRRRFIGG